MSRPARVVVVSALLLAVLHHDFWFWNDRTLVLGFVPVGLAYHICYSLAAACLWFGATRWSWPSTLGDREECGLRNAECGMLNEEEAERRAPEDLS